MKKFGKKGKDGAHKEEKESNNRHVWKPFRPNNFTKDEKQK